VSERKRAKRKDAGKQAARLAYEPLVLPDHPPEDAALTRAPELLGKVADALNECARAGIFARLAHGAVITDAGYVFAVQSERGFNYPSETWVVRTRMLTEFPVSGEDD
jgi:hypothetical protein